MSVYSDALEKALSELTDAAKLAKQNQKEVSDLLRLTRALLLQVSSGTEPDNSGTDPLSEEQHNA